MVQKIKYQDMPLYMTGMGTIDDSRPIDLLEYALPVSKCKHAVYPVSVIPKRITVSKKIGRTVYDVTADFDVDGKRTVLQQFKELILQTKTISQN